MPSLVRALSASLMVMLLAFVGCGSTSEGPRGAGGSGGGAAGGGGDAPLGSDVLCGTRPMGSPWGTHVLRFESTDPRVVVQIVRSFAGSGVGESSLYALESFGLVSEGRTECVTDASALSYTNTHHNWEDRASAVLEGVRYELEMTFFVEVDLVPSWKFVLTAPGQAPTELTRTGGPFACFSCPASLPIYVSEVLVRNTTTHADEAGEYEPWIELFNPSAGPLDLSGWSLSNDLQDRARWTFPAVTIPRHGFVVVFADGEPAEGPLHTSVRLPEEGGELVLTSPSGVIDGGFAYGSSAPDLSLIADFEDGVYVESTQPTPGARNPNMVD